ncbi:hypothetical protein WA026_002523 [Henosepilachna vigintioctopunctata]|uniref:Ionotropic receptor n=1 Tax=Henosepilachna vigintioctopunctata TaxID=420089 RepID=A0AAW1U2N5_9CUCU
MLCLNNILKEVQVNSTVIVVNYEYALDAPTIRLNLKENFNLMEFTNFQLFVKHCIVNIDDIDFEQFVHFKKRTKLNEHIKFVLIGERWPFEKFRQFLHIFQNIIHINSRSGDISTFVMSQKRYSRKIVIKKHGNCLENNFNLSEVVSRISIYQGSRITVCYFQIPPYGMSKCGNTKGISVEITALALDMLNISAHFKGYIFPRMTLNQHYHYVFSNDICTIHVQAEAMKDFDFTQPYVFDHLNWIVPTPEEIPRWKFAFQVFSSDVWLTWVISCLVLSLAWYATEFTMNSKPQLKQLAMGLEIIFTLFLQQSSNIKISTISTRIVLATIIISTFFINLFYICKFSYLLSGMNYENSIETLEDVMEKSLYVRIPDEVNNYYKDEEKILQYFKLFRKDFEYSLKEAASLRNSITSNLHRSYIYNLKDVLDDNKRVLLEEMRTPIKVAHLTAVLPKGNALTKLLSDKFGHLRQHGLVDYVTSKYYKFPAEGTNVEKKKLTLTSIQFPLCAWIIGIIFSLIAFLNELNIFNVVINWIF